MTKILVLEDDPEICDAIQTALTAHMHTVDAVSTGDAAIDFVSTYQYELAILDINVPGPSGLDVLQHIRLSSPATKVILLTTLGSVPDKVKGLESGADDYLPKPFDIRELLARISALSRRPNAVVDDIIERGGLVLNRRLFEIRKHGVLVKVQPKDFALLEFLMRHPNDTFSAERLLDSVWSADSNASIDGLRMSVSRLRKVLDEPEAKTSVIVSVNRVGYRFGLE